MESPMLRSQEVGELCKELHCMGRSDIKQLILCLLSQIDYLKQGFQKAQHMIILYRLHSEELLNKIECLENGPVQCNQNHCEQVNKQGRVGISKIMKMQTMKKSLRMLESKQDYWDNRLNQLQKSAIRIQCSISGMPERPCKPSRRLKTTTDESKKISPCSYTDNSDNYMASAAKEEVFTEKSSNKPRRKLKGWNRTVSTIETPPSRKCSYMYE